MKSSGYKIAMIGHKRIPSREGGVEIVVEELSTRMAERGYNVTVYNRRGHHVSGKKYDKICTEKEYKKVKIIKVPTIEKKGLAALTSSFFATIHAVFKGYDCIHYHAEGPSVMLAVAHLFRKKTVATIHGLDWQRAKWGGFAKRYLLLGEKIAAKYADEVIVLSKNVQNYFKKTYGRETVFIPNGIENPNIVEATEITVKWKLDKDGYILYLGRIVPEKGIHYLIKAYDDICKLERVEKKLVIAGGASDTSEYMAELKEMSKSNNNIIFTDFVQGKTLEELYSNAYVYVLPSDLEGMPISLLEAMSYGNCCIVSNIDECTEVVQDKAFVFEKSNIESLKKVLNTALIKRDVVDGYKASASEYICNRYSWNKVCDETLEIYTDIIKRKRKRK